MFTGIVTAIGTIVTREERGDLHLRIACPWDPATIAIGASIACAGVCLTVVERGGQAGDAWFAVDVSAETLSRTARGTWEEGSSLNLEASLRVGDELGGHIVSGHVDAVGTVISREVEGDSIRLTIEAPPALAPFLAEKGSVAVDGVSLTVNSVEDQADGDEVNLEIDTVARYLRRLESLRA